MRVDLAKKAFKDLYVNKGLHWVNDHFDWFVKTYVNLLDADMNKKNPEAWREENRKKQAAGVKFEHKDIMGNWGLNTWDFCGRKEDYREVLQEVQKEGDMRIPEASREVLKQWQAKGLKFKVIGMTARFALEFTDKTGSNYSIPDQPIPEGMSVETVEAMWRQGLRVEFDEPYGRQGWTEIGDTFTWSGDRATFKSAELLKRLRIPAQPIPEKLLEAPPTPHAAERALWKAQRDAGTNEVWQERLLEGIMLWDDLRFEPAWRPEWEYRVKPMKLTAKIIRRGVYKTSYYWEFTGTREEYRAECEKYGYVVVSNIEEVKTDTVKYYFALYKTRCGHISIIDGPSEKWIKEWVEDNGKTIIGNIETREVEV